MLSTGIARFGATAAFVGGFWLIGQPAAQADDGTTDALSELASATHTGAEAEIEVSGGDASVTLSAEAGDGGDGGEAAVTLSAEDGDDTALGTGSSVTVGNVCATSPCESTPTVDADVTTTAEGQEVAVIGGGDSADTTSTQSVDTADNAVLGADGATTDERQKVDGTGVSDGAGGAPSPGTAASTPRSAEGAVSDRVTDAGNQVNDRDGIDAGTTQSAGTGDDPALGTGNDFTVANACVASECSSRQKDDDSDDTISEGKQKAFGLGGGAAYTTSPPPAGAGVLGIPGPAATGTDAGGLLGSLGGVAALVVGMLFVLAAANARSR